MKKKIFFRVGNLAIKIIAVVILIWSASFGWIPGRDVVVSLSEEQQGLQEYLHRVVDKLAGEIGPRNFHHYDSLESAKKYIIEEFEALDYQVSLQSYSVKDKVFSNIIATKNPSTDQRPLIVGAHYDSFFNPGADDNASGVAGVLGLAKLFSSKDVVKDMMFVAFVNEEPPFFQTDNMGSRVFTRSLKERNQQIRGAIILEMIGYYSDNWFSQRYFFFLGPFFPNKGNFIGFVGNFPSLFLTRSLAKGFQKKTSFPLRTITAPSFIPGFNFSDHWSFWKEGYPALMVTDTAFLRNPHYHQQTDLPGTLNYTYMTQVVYGLKGVILETLSGPDFD